MKNNNVQQIDTPDIKTTETLSVKQTVQIIRGETLIKDKDVFTIDPQDPYRLKVFINKYNLNYKPHEPTNFFDACLNAIEQLAKKE